MPRWIDPLARAVDVVLALPDRHATLELLDDPARDVVGGTPMRVCDGDPDARLFQRELAEPMLDGDVGRREAAPRLVRDGGKLPLRHRLVRRVLDAGHGAPVVHLAHGAEKEKDRAM